MDENNLNANGNPGLKADDDGQSFDLNQVVPVDNQDSATEDMPVKLDAENTAEQPVETPVVTPSEESVETPMTQVESVMEDSASLEEKPTLEVAAEAETPAPEPVMELPKVEPEVTEAPATSDVSTDEPVAAEPEPVSMPDEPLVANLQTETLETPAEPTVETPLEVSKPESEPTMDLPEVTPEVPATQEASVDEPVAVEPEPQPVETATENISLEANSSPEVTVTPDAEPSEFDMTKPDSNLEIPSIIQDENQSNTISGNQVDDKSGEFAVNAKPASQLSQKSNSTKGIMYVVLVLICVGLIGFGSYHFFFKGNDSDVGETTEVEKSEEVNKLEEALSDDVSNGPRVIPDALQQVEEAIGSQEDYNNSIDGLLHMVVGEEAMNEAADNSGKVRR